MLKYLSNRQRTLKVGISSHTDSDTVLNVVGKVGIGTTNATRSLDVSGDVRLRGAIYDKNDSIGLSGYVPISDGEGSWVWNEIDTGRNFPTGDYGDLSTSIDSFGVSLALTFDCKIDPENTLATKDLGDSQSI